MRATNLKRAVGDRKGAVGNGQWAVEFRSQARVDLVRYGAERLLPANSTRSLESGLPWGGRSAEFCHLSGCSAKDRTVRWTKSFIPTMKEDPSDAEVPATG